MPIYQSIWKIDGDVEELKGSKLVSENELEDIIQEHIDILNENWLVIGRQVPTAYNQYIDLLALDGNGSVIIIELKKDKTPRNVVSQALDYALWVKNLGPEDIAEIFKDFVESYKDEANSSLDEVFGNKFHRSIEEDDLNSSHQIVIVATGLDSSTERIVTYLVDSGIPINVVFFKVLEDEGRRYLSRAWFMDPKETEETATIRKYQEPWNGEFYVSFGDDSDRDWNDAKRYGFISAGGGSWYTKTLSLLSVGDRVWANIPHTGYVGVGIVKAPVRKADEVYFDVNGTQMNIYELSDRANYYKQYVDDEDNAEYIVKVDWIKTVDKAHAVKEVGFFGNQNTVCRPTSLKWNHTVERLKKRWEIE